MKISLLDCTLRDGGYNNEWNFGYENINNIFDRLVASGVDYLEIGFLNNRYSRSLEHTIQPNIESFEDIFKFSRIEKTKIVAMIDFGTFDISEIKEKSQTFIDGIRVIFKKDKLKNAFKFIHELKNLGYIVFAQAVSITSYSEKELDEFFNLANEVLPFAVSIVDTYGLLHANDLVKLADLFNRNLSLEISLGYHAHNNFQLAYSNSISFIEKDYSRNIFIDGTLYGFGKSAGNAPTELLGMYLNRYYNKKYDINQMLEAIQTSIFNEYKKNPWGYNLTFYLSSLNNCHQNYVNQLLNKRTLSIDSINQLLSEITDDMKLNYNKKYMDDLYLKFQKKELNDNEALILLTNNFLNKTIVILGPGNTLFNEKNEVMKFIENNNSIVIGVNSINESYKQDYVFFTNNQRLLRFSSKLNLKEFEKLKIIHTSNLNIVTNNEKFVVNYSNLIDDKNEFPDNSLLMLIRLMIKMNVKLVNLAGFDGYTPNLINYFDKNLEYDFIKEKSVELNNQTINFLNENAEKIQIEFLTSTLYKKKHL